MKEYLLCATADFLLKQCHEALKDMSVQSYPNISETNNTFGF